jgi:DNA-binding winged helix-turn-helix (wHTH) protein/Tfp pilus assembly protein PilF
VAPSGAEPRTERARLAVELHVPEPFLVGEWTVTPSRNLLARGADEVRLEPRVMDVLVHLAARADGPVSKDELMATVWKDRYVTDDVLTVAIYALRKALGDEARKPRYIETVSRRGYRLIAPLQPISLTPAAADHLGTPERGALHSVETGALQSVLASPDVRGYSWTTIAAAIALVLFASGGTWMLSMAREAVDPRRPGQHRQATSAEAHEAYVKGRYFLDQRSIRGWRQALEHFERAVALDPENPAAHAGLADTYSAMSDFGVASPAELRPRALQAVERALALDRRSAEGLAALGRAQFLFDWNFSAADRSLTRAVALDPDYMPAHQTMAWLTSARGQSAEAIASARRALQLDPVNTARYTELAWVLALAGRHDEALREIDRALQLSPRSFETHLMKGWAFELAGQPDTAFAAYRDALRLSGVPEESLQRIDAVYRASGLSGYYRGWLNRGATDGPMSDTWRAQLHVRVGELDQAIASLERAYEKREGALAWVNVEPSFQPLRSDARFQQIAARVGERD